jgi:hypothetical protein
MTCRIIPRTRRTRFVQIGAIWTFRLVVVSPSWVALLQILVTQRTLFPAVIFSATFSPMVVVTLSGPPPCPSPSRTWPTLGTPRHDALLQRPFASTRNLRIYFNIIICIKETEGENKGLAQTLTFFPSSFAVYSIVVRIPLLSTKSSFFGVSVT